MSPYFGSGDSARSAAMIFEKWMCSRSRVKTRALVAATATASIPTDAGRKSIRLGSPVLASTHTTILRPASRTSWDWASVLDKTISHLRFACRSRCS